MSQPPTNTSTNTDNVDNSATSASTTTTTTTAANASTQQLATAVFQQIQLLQAQAQAQAQAQTQALVQNAYGAAVPVTGPAVTSSSHNQATQLAALLNQVNPQLLQAQLAAAQLQASQAQLAAAQVQAQQHAQAAQYAQYANLDIAALSNSLTAAAAAAAAAAPGTTTTTTATAAAGGGGAAASVGPGGVKRKQVDVPSTTTSSAVWPATYKKARQEVSESDSKMSGPGTDVTTTTTTTTTATMLSSQQKHHKKKAKSRAEKKLALAASLAHKGVGGKSALMKPKSDNDSESDNASEIARGTFCLVQRDCRHIFNTELATIGRKTASMVGDDLKCFLAVNNAKNVSRKHLQIKWNRLTGVFEAHITGKNGASIDGQFHKGKNIDPIPLRHQAKIDIEGEEMFFVLPGQKISSRQDRTPMMIGHDTQYL
jgi:FHA domain